MATSTMTRVQFHTLIAISRGEVSKPAPGIDYDYGTWRLEGNRGLAVTRQVEALITKGYAHADTPPRDDRIYARPTAAGTEAISAAR